MFRMTLGAWPPLAVVGLVLCPVDVSAGLPGQTAVGAEDGTHWLVVQPGYPGSTEDAAGFMRSFSEYLEERTGLPNVRGVYHNVPEDGLTAIRSRPPAFALVSLGFYLEHRRSLGLEALLESQPQDRFVIVALEGTVSGPEALRGAKVAGGPLYEQAFLERVVFRGKAPAAGWKGEPVLRSSRALRRLERGTYAAVVLTGREFAVFSSVSRRKKLEKVLESAYYPQSLLVHFRSRPPSEEKPKRSQQEETRQEKTHQAEKSPGEDSRAAEKRSLARTGREPSRDSSGDLSGGARGLSRDEQLRLKDAFLRLVESVEGKALLKTMGIRGFAAVRSQWLKRMEGIFDAEEKK